MRYSSLVAAVGIIALGVLSACIDTEPDNAEFGLDENGNLIGGSGSGGTGGGTGGGTSAVMLQIELPVCNSLCTLSNASANVQVASQCDAAGVRYDMYRDNVLAYNSGRGCESTSTGTVCVTPTDLTTLYSYYTQQHELARETYARFGC